MIRPGNYYPGRPNPHTVSIDLGPLKLYFSYNDRIAFSENGVLHCNETFYSPTSTKHLGILKRKYANKRYYPVESDFLGEWERAVSTRVIVMGDNISRWEAERSEKESEDDVTDGIW